MAVHAHITYHPPKGPAQRDRAMLPIIARDQAMYLAREAGMYETVPTGCTRHGEDVQGTMTYRAQADDGSSLHVNLCPVRHV